MPSTMAQSAGLSHSGVTVDCLWVLATSVIWTNTSSRAPVSSARFNDSLSREWYWSLKGCTCPCSQ